MAKKKAKSSKRTKKPAWMHDVTGSDLEKERLAKLEKKARAEAKKKAGRKKVKKPFSTRPVALPRGGRVRIGILGGGFGTHFQWNLHPNCEVAAVCDRDIDRRKAVMKKYECDNAYVEYEDMLAGEDLDAVAVFSGAPDHVDHAIMAMDHGLHVCSAVPAATTLADCRRLIRKKEKTGLRYMMAETCYYYVPAMFAKEMYETGLFGKLQYCEGEYYHPGLGRADDELSHFKGRRTWRYGIPPMHYVTHSSTFYIGVTGRRLTSVVCEGWSTPDRGYRDNEWGNPYANEAALFTTSEGTVFRCNVFWDAFAHCCNALWLGTDASMWLNLAWQEIAEPVIRTKSGKELKVPDYTRSLPKQMRGLGSHGGSESLITHEFISAILQDREPQLDVYEAVAMTAPGIVAHQSAMKGGKRLKVPSFDKTPAK